LRAAFQQQTSYTSPKEFLEARKEGLKSKHLMELRKLSGALILTLETYNRLFVISCWSLPRARAHAKRQDRLRANSGRRLAGGAVFDSVGFKSVRQVRMDNPARMGQLERGVDLSLELYLQRAASEQTALHDHGRASLADQDQRVQVFKIRKRQHARFSLLLIARQIERCIF